MLERRGEGRRQAVRGARLCGDGEAGGVLAQGGEELQGLPMAAIPLI